MLESPVGPIVTMVNHVAGEHAGQLRWQLLPACPIVAQ